MISSPSYGVLEYLHFGSRSALGTFGYRRKVTLTSTDEVKIRMISLQNRMKIPDRTLHELGLAPFYLVFFH